MTMVMNIKGRAGYAVNSDGRFVVLNGPLPLLLSGRGDPDAAIDRAAGKFVDHLVMHGFGEAMEYLASRGVYISFGPAAEPVYPADDSCDEDVGTHDFELVLTS